LIALCIRETKHIGELLRTSADAIPMASKLLSFSGRVAVITGGGGGLGEKYAIDLAKRGASVVINDVTESADRVHALVKRIGSDGGIAKANINSVLEGKQIIDDAINHFGSCDILINNAGILRDKSFHKMTKQEWNSVIDVHLQGTFELCHAGIKNLMLCWATILPLTLIF
jgi:NAD(P)-dependent dehydrogenase (short-subunit alcohol dehydrogenase family)